MDRGVQDGGCVSGACWVVQARISGRPSPHRQEGRSVEQEVRPGLPQAGGARLPQWGDHELTPSCLVLGQGDGTLS